MQGDLEVLGDPTIAIVGSRRSSSYGNRTSLWMAHELARSGITICSGLARGIDGQAHRGALKAEGKTIAVVATGLDRVYPDEHELLASEIADNGLLISEFPLNTPPRKENFPRRNRIISGLSFAVLVVEANLRSGSLITARQALEQNREVFVVPGRIDSDQSRGCHRLIKQGAQLSESPLDILQGAVDLDIAIPNLNRVQQQSMEECSEKLQQSKPNKSGTTLAPAPAGNETQRIILNTIGNEQVLLDYLLSETEIPMATLASELMTLEIEGLISTRGGRYFKSET